VLAHPARISHEGSLIDLIEVAHASIKTLPLMAEQADVSPSEPVFVVLTASQLADTLTRALQPLQDEISQLKGIVANLEAKVSALEATQDTQADNQLIQLRIISQLREATRKEPQKASKRRV
jgi:hypothetical protein